jgi:outer membrane protein assembly factor BamB
MSTVYSARDLRFGQVERLCAVKEMVDSDPDPGTRALRLVNFERESALLATITHPAVPKIYDYFAQSGLVYLVLEYIDGQDLERALHARKAPFPDREIARWALEICDVLAMLHNNEPNPIIFRDLKPSNIMLRRNGHISLIDFGIARVFQPRQRGTMIGTEGYAPPEQYRGIADARGDIYALGATLHQLVTNTDPRQETPFTFHERSIRALNPDVSVEFEQIVQKMVAYHPDERYQTIEELEVSLERFLNPPRAAATAVLDQTRLPPPIVVISDADREPAASLVERGAETLPVEMAVARVERRRASRKRTAARRRGPAGDLERVSWSVQTGDEVRGTARFTGEYAVIGSYDGYAYAIRPDDGSVGWKFATGRGVVARPALWRDLVLIASEDQTLYGVTADTGALRWSYRTGLSIRSSPAVRGDIAVVGSDDASIYGIDCHTGEPIWRQRVWGPVRSSPWLDGDVTLVGSDDGYLYALKTSDGTICWRYQCGGPVQPSPHAAEHRVFIAGRNGLVSAVAKSNGARVWQHQLDMTVVASPRVRSGVLVIGTADGLLVSLDSATGSRRWGIRYSNQITSTALLTDTTCYVGTIDGDMLSVRLADGELNWKHQVGGPIVSSPVFARGNLVIGSTDGSIYAIALAEAEAAEFVLEG